MLKTWMLMAAMGFASTAWANGTLVRCDLIVEDSNKPEDTCFLGNLDILWRGSYLRGRAWVEHCQLFDSRGGIFAGIRINQDATELTLHGDGIEEETIAWDATGRGQGESEIERISSVMSRNRRFHYRCTNVAGSGGYHLVLRKN